MDRVHDYFGQGFKTFCNKHKTKIKYSQSLIRLSDLIRMPEQNMNCFASVYGSLTAALKELFVRFISPEHVT